MSLMKIDPMFPMSTSMGKLFDDFFNQRLGEAMGSTSTLPSVNIAETPDSYELEIAAPGLKKDEFDVNVEDNTLTISVERSGEEETKEDSFVRREFNYSSFSRSFQLPNTVNAQDIHAKYDNGVLHLSIPKKEEAKVKPPKKIEIS